MTFEDFDDYQKAARSTAIYPQNYAVVYPALGLAGETGEVAEKIKKVIRDGPGLAAMTNEQRDRLAKELGDVLWYVANLACDLQLSLSGIAELNVIKLRQREQTGTLRGSGDERGGPPCG